MRSPESPPAPLRRRRQDGAPSRWDRYVSLLERQRIPEKARPYSVRFVETFLRDLRAASGSELTGDRITDYFCRVSSSSKLADWQFRQAVEAIQLVLVDLAPVAAGKEIDWDCWKEAAKELGGGHSTLAKGQAPGDGVAARIAGPSFAPGSLLSRQLEPSPLRFSARTR